jgi:hypothetical protein
MAEHSNPAARLQALLDEASLAAAKVKNPRIAQVWAEVLNVDADDLPELLSRLSRVYALPSQIREEMALVPNIDPDQIMEHLPVIEQAFAKFAVQNQWQQFAETITPAAKYSVATCANVLNGISPEPAIADSDVERLADLARALFDEVMGSDLEPALKQYLGETLAEVLRAIDLYKVNGVRGLEHAIDAAMGRFLRTQPGSTEGRARAAAKKVFGFLKGLSVAIALLNATHSLVNNYGEILWGDEPPLPGLIESIDETPALPPGGTGGSEPVE